MMKAAHFVQVAPNRSGLYETARELAWGQNAFCSWDARLIDVTGVVTEGGESIQDGEDRGVKISDLEWAKNADLHFLHTGIPREIEGTKPVVHVAHGLPEYTLYSQLLVETTNDAEQMERLSQKSCLGGPWSLVKYLSDKPWLLAAVTFWPRHVQYWEPYFKNVILANHFCDSDKFTPEGETCEYLRPATGDGLNITFADHWRLTAFKDPFQILHGARKFCMDTGSRIHLYAVPEKEMLTKEHPWNVIVYGVSNNLEHTIGDIFTVHGDIASVHRTADLLVTPSCDDTRTILEASACGCPVLSRKGAGCSTFNCRFEDPEDVDKMLRLIHQRILKSRKRIRSAARKKAQGFTIEAAVKKIEAGILEVL